MNRLRKFLVKYNLVKSKPHEKAELGKGTYGRQVSPIAPASAKGKGTISARVIRKDGTIENLGRLK